MITFPCGLHRGSQLTRIKRDASKLQALAGAKGRILTASENDLMIRVLSVVAAIAVSATAVYAQSAAIGQRKEILKSWGAAMKAPGTMVKGEAPFELAKVQASLKTIAEGAPKLEGLFPDDSKTGGDTQALPAIWEKKAEFLAIYKKIAADATAASAAIKDEATFKAEWPKIGANCGTCHKSFRQPPK